MLMRKNVNNDSAKTRLLREIHSPLGNLYNYKHSIGLHLVWACKIDDGEFEFGYHFNNHLNPFRRFLSLLVAK